MVNDVPPRSPTVVNDVPPRSPTVAHDVPPRSPMMAHDLPPRSPVMAHDVPPRSPTVENDVPPRSPMMVNDVPPRSPTMVNDVPPRSPMMVNDVPPRSPRVVNDVPPRSPMMVNDVPPRSPRVAHAVPPPTASPGPTRAPTVAAAMRAEPHQAPADASGLIRLLLTLLVGAAAFVAVSATLRPLRRAVTLRHLRRPYWPETLEQRVSNLWQLALVGLRDAGFCARAGEQPQELARRVRIDGLAACASVLERARHGIGLDPSDLAAMTRAAELAYCAARTRLGRFARAAALVRWPLA